ncbi:N-formylglutamate amidohydrolase [uncultured Roseobacter sp.]|uniref:N-formylglutamate amidohydrolase n=1 Tax=uncultured Roseobacter sp. TaxID=114847 RepID=UPI00262EB3E3|nr:N-formylglutamate amidohydrolase [uncultured Roseobacter sp.]
MSRSNVIDASVQGQSGQENLLSASDPAPVEWCIARAQSPIFLLCEHAGRAVPQALDGLGLPEGAIDRHIGWDIGAEALARAVSHRLECPLILQRYSRLVIDCNRPPGSAGSIPAVSDGIRVPGNVGLNTQASEQRRREIFDPMNDAIAAAFEFHPRQAVFAIHSFTQNFQGQLRPWDAGFLTRSDTETAGRLMEVISAAAPDLRLALNQPYQIDDASDWFIPRYAEARAMRHTLIEVRNDHLTDEAGVTRWADLLTPAIRSVLEVSQ